MPLSALGVSSSPPVTGQLFYAWRCDGRRQVDGWPADVEVERRWTERMRRLARATPAFVVMFMVSAELLQWWCASALRVCVLVCRCIALSVWLLFSALRVLVSKCEWLSLPVRFASVAVRLASGVF